MLWGEWSFARCLVKEDDIVCTDGFARRWQVLQPPNAVKCSVVCYVLTSQTLRVSCQNLSTATATEILGNTARWRQGLVWRCVWCGRLDWCWRDLPLYVKTLLEPACRFVCWIRVSLLSFFIAVRTWIKNNLMNLRIFAFVFFVKRRMNKKRWWSWWVWR